VLVEEPTYSGVIELASQRGQRVVSVPMDSDGINLSALEQICATLRPRILYTIPTFHNPIGVSLAETRRKALLQLAERWDLLILEDDVYGWLSYDGPAPLALKADDENERVVYIGSFSKVLFPALRLGAVVAAQPLLLELVAVKESCELVSSLFMQKALAWWLKKGSFEGHLDRILPLYRERRDAMIEALSKHMPPGSFIAPHGGFNVWITLPHGTSERELFLEAVERGVGLARGSQFYYQPTPGAHLRLSFAAQTPARIRDGVARLGRLLEGHLDRRRTALARASRAASPLV
jgi:DNA-binding transcriptional MocR family regulator